MSNDNTDITAPNLDAMDKADLGAFVKDTVLLTRYAQTKINAMTAREKGDIDTARLLEGQCEAIYKLLPQHLRW